LVLTNSQYGFRTKKSTEQATFALLNNILTAMNDNQKVGGIFCDIQKAFDCVNHQILLEKLEYYGIKGKIETLIKSYLTGRYQKLILDRSSNTNNSSKWELIKAGVPQGSVLGPLFFLIYVNDLPNVVTKTNSVVLFADDTGLLITDSDSQNFNFIVNQTFKNVNTWFNSNLLQLSYNKTHHVEYRTKDYYQIQTKVQYKNNIIPNFKMTKFLGLIIDETLTWNQHIEFTTTKLCSACYAIRNLKHIVPQSTLRTLYYAYVHPILSYGIIFWGRSSKVTKLFILQKRIVRVLTNTGARESCRDVFWKMEILTLYSQYFFSLIVFTVENKHLFTLNKDIHTHATRYNSNIHLINCKFN
jgi:hypothetical protein